MKNIDKIEQVVAEYKQLLSNNGGRRDRADQADQILKALRGNIKEEGPINIVETGASQSWADGMLGLMFAKIANVTGGKMWFVDIDRETVNKSIKAYQAHGIDCVESIVADSVTFLQDFNESVDIYHLDSWDLDLMNPYPSALHGWREFDAIREKAAPDTVVIVDDNYLRGSYVVWNWWTDDGRSGQDVINITDPCVGKGALIHGWLLDENTDWNLLPGSEVGQNTKIIGIKGHGWKFNKTIVPQARYEILPQLLNDRDAKKGVEIGVFKAEFSKQLLNSWNGNLYMVDPWRALGDEYIDRSNHQYYTTAYAEAMENIRGLEDRAFMVRALSSEAVEIFEDESLDFVYIDGNHAYDYVKEDMQLWWPKLKKGGIFAGHDYINIDWSDGSFLENGKDKHMYFNNTAGEEIYGGIFGVNPAVDEFCQEYGYNLNVTNEFCGTWYFIK